MRPVEVIYLRRWDTIDSARELLLSASSGAQVWLVLPWRWNVARRQVNIRRLQHTAEGCSLDLRLVSAHVQTRLLSREIGLPAYALVPLGLRRYRKRRSPRSRANGRLHSVDERTASRLLRRSRGVGIGAFFLTIVVIALLVVVMAAAGVLLIPSATVTIRPIAESVSAVFLVTARTEYREIDYGRAVVPARYVQVVVEGSGSTPATGGLEMPDGHASGEVVLANRTTEPVLVPKGTIVRTSSGVNIRFYTVSDVEIPGALYAYSRVVVIALEPGPEGNVAPLTINTIEGQVAQAIDVLNDAPTDGGTNKRVSIVRSDDFNTLRQEMVSSLQEEAYVKLVSELNEGEFVPPDSLGVEIMSARFHEVLDETSETLTMEMQIVTRGIAVDNSGIDQLATLLLEQQGGADLRLIPTSLIVDVSDGVRVQAGAMRFEVTARGMVAPIIQTESLKSAMRGQTLPEAMGSLVETARLETAPVISLFPEWWDRLPFLSGRIEIAVESGAR